MTRRWRNVLLALVLTSSLTFGVAHAAGPHKTKGGTQVECIYDPELQGYYVLFHRGSKNTFEVFPGVVPACTIEGAIGGEPYEPEIQPPIEWPFPVTEEPES